MFAIIGLTAPVLIHFKFSDKRIGHWLAVCIFIRKIYQYIYANIRKTKIS